jgi:hypothetical protein
MRQLGCGRISWESRSGDWEGSAREVHSTELDPSGLMSSIPMGRLPECASG